MFLVNDNCKQMHNELYSNPKEKSMQVYYQIAASFYVEFSLEQWQPIIPLYKVVLRCRAQVLIFRILFKYQSFGNSKLNDSFTVYTMFRL